MKFFDFMMIFGGGFAGAITGGVIHRWFLQWKIARAERRAGLKK
jgi:hypothetical protein